MLATVNGAHYGDEVCDVMLSGPSHTATHAVPDGLYLVSAGGDETVRCRKVMELLRQQLTLRVLAESEQTEMGKPVTPKMHSAQRMESGRHGHHHSMMSDGSDSDFGPTSY